MFVERKAVVKIRVMATKYQFLFRNDFSFSTILSNSIIFSLHGLEKNLPLI